MSQLTNKLPSLQTSYMWTDNDVPMKEPHIENKLRSNASQLKTIKNNSYDRSQTSNDPVSLHQIIDPRFDQLMDRRLVKIFPYRNDVDLQKMTTQTTKNSISNLQFSSNIPSNITNASSNQMGSQISSISIKDQFTSKTTRNVGDIRYDGHDRTMICAYVLMFILCIALIVVPIALVFGLSKQIEISTDAGTTTTISTRASTTTMAPVMVSITRAGDLIMGLYNTTAGGSTGSSNGRYPGPTQTPAQAIDGVIATKYLNFGINGVVGAVLHNPGVNTGFYVTPAISNYSIASALLFATANDYPKRDPITVTLEGTNVTGIGSLDLGSSWTLIYSGPTGINLTNDPGRSVYVSQQNFSNNIAFSSYRVLVTSQRNDTDSVQYAEANILGYI